MKKIIAFGITLTFLTVLLIVPQIGQAAKLPPEKAGEISAPLGNIAYIKSGDLWVMKWDGTNQFKVVTAQNADGGISWSPDNKKICFTRKGYVDLKGPDMMGGRHSVYDVFVAFIDSALNQNTNFWHRLTGTIGARHPQYSKDGSRIYLTYDLHANTVDAIMPNYQVAYVDSLGNNLKVIRTDYDNNDSLFTNQPTLGPNGLYAFGIIQKTNPYGIGIAPLSKTTLTKKDLGTTVKTIQSATAPAWSPDGKWLAFVNTDINKQGIYITDADLSETYTVYRPGPGQSLQTYPLSWSSNSKYITFGLQDGSLWYIDLTGNGLKQLTGAGMNSCPTFSK